jgi:hypothetical protein
MSYVIKSRVVSLEKKKRALSARKISDTEVHWEYEDTGWFVRFEGSWEALFVGMDRPMDLEPGTEVEIVIRAAR